VTSVAVVAHRAAVSASVRAICLAAEPGMRFNALQSQRRLAFNLLGAREVEDDWVAQPSELSRFAGLLDGPCASLPTFV